MCRPFSGAGHVACRNCGPERPDIQKPDKREVQDDEVKGELQGVGVVSGGSEEQVAFGRQANMNRTPDNPTAAEREKHEATHLPYQPWCKFCVQGKCPNRKHSSKSKEETEYANHTCILTTCLWQRRIRKTCHQSWYEKIQNTNWYLRTLCQSKAFRMNGWLKRLWKILTASVMDGPRWSSVAIRMLTIQCEGPDGRSSRR